MIDYCHNDSGLNKATVIIPCYNVEAYIHECLDSVALQGDVVHHIYVVDNNSTDATVDKVIMWQNANPTFPLILLSESKPGAPAARNSPLNRVETKWVQFLDADDLLLPGKIYDQIRKHSSGDVICAGFQRVSLLGEKSLARLNKNIPIALIQGTAGITSSNLFSTKSLQSVQGWDESIKSSQEYDLMFRIWQTGAKFELDLAPRASIRERPSGQISQRNPVEKWTQFVELRMRMLGVFDFNQTLTAAELREAHQVFYSQLLILANHDFDAAKNIFFKTLIPLGFQPKGTGMKGLLNGLLFRTMGFGANIKLKQLISRYRSMLTKQGSTT